MTTENKTINKAQVRTPGKAVAAKLLQHSKKTLKLPVVIRPGEDGFFVAEVPILPGCISQGKTKSEALINIREAAELYLETVSKSLPGIPEQYITEVEVTF